MLLENKIPFYVSWLMMLIIFTRNIGSLANAEMTFEEEDKLAEYHYSNYDEELYDEAVPKIQFCCGRHHYFDMTNRTCTLSDMKLEPIFHKQNGTEIKNAMKYSNFTKTNDCASYIATQPDDFVLLETGELLMKSPDETIIHYVSLHQYCLIWTGYNSSHHDDMAALVCFPEEKSEQDVMFSKITTTYILPTAMTISALFLAATFFVYCLVKELQDMLGKCLMCSVSALCFSKIFGVLGMVAFTVTTGVCVTVGILMYTGFLVSFFWLNVLSIIVFISIWYQGKIGLFSRKRWFISGCIYAYGVPFLIIAILLIHDFTNKLDNSVIPKPGLGYASCGFSDRGANIVYFYAPITVLLAINLILFCFSACRLLVLTKQRTANAFQFKHYMKLFILMGIPWIFEVLSYFLADMKILSAASVVWFIFDLFNALQGVIIFVVFVCRKAVLARLSEVVCGKDFATRKYPEFFNQQNCDEGNLNLSQDFRLTEPDKKNESTIDQEQKKDPQDVA